MNDIKLFNKISDKEKREFFPLAEHKLRTPVAGLKWSIELLLDDASLNKETKETINDIYQINQKTIETLTDFFIILKIREFKLKSIPVELNVNDEVKNVLESLKKEVDSMKIKIDIDIDDSTITVDKKLFTLFLKNILSNAIKFNKENGKIHVKINSSDEINFVIEDTGIGIPKKEQDRVLELFYRASNTSKYDISGSGLGLPIINALVNGWGGKLEFSSIEDKGTKFTISLPRLTKSEFKLISIKNG